MSTKELQVQDFPKKFPCGEIHVRTISSLDVLKDSTGMLWIEKRIQSSDDIMEILMLADAIRRDYIGIKNTRLALRIPYVPYSRQDRVMVPGESLSIKVFADLINSVKFDVVEIWDPHSDVTPALLNNCSILPQEDLVGLTLGTGTWEHYTLICPDAGARKKILKCQSTMNAKGIIYADKVRDPATGAITGVSIDISGVAIPYNDDIQDFIVIDDICDGGRTFVEISKALRTYPGLLGIKYNLHLHVTHGFFTQGLEPLLPHFETISCANLMNKDMASVYQPSLTYYKKV